MKQIIIVFVISLLLIGLPFLLLQADNERSALSQEIFEKYCSNQ